MEGNGFKKILMIKNCPIEGLGLYGAQMRNQHVICDIFRAYTERKFPTFEHYDGFIVGGTPISVRDIKAHPFLRREREVLERVIGMNKPILGICFGAQLLAQLLGAEVKEHSRREAGCYRVTLTSLGKRSRLFENFPEQFPVFQWHADTFEIPEGGNLLVQSNSCMHQAFSYNTIVGLQFHLEVIPEMVERWITKYAEELDEVNKTRSQIMAECIGTEREMERLSNMFVKNYLTMLWNHDHPMKGETS